jgi:hypothetical protein
MNNDKLLKSPLWFTVAMTVTQLVGIWSIIQCLLWFVKHVTFVIVD